ncbi:MAG TPA: hypothetical protein VHM25_01350 [Polyangiaceae bacterium]|nr:hypothetical protein [Polyangiaceae bacterium]
MPNLEIASPSRAPKSPDNHPRVPFHTCIRLEDVHRARTSSIDAEWETLSAVPTDEGNTLPIVSARPRMETLPGIGTVDEPTPNVVTKPRRSAGARLFVSMLAATFASSIAFVGASAWQSHEPNAVAIALAPAARVAPLAPAPLPRPVQIPSSSPSPVAVEPRAVAVVSDAEPASAKPAHSLTPQPGSASTVTPPTAVASAARTATPHRFRSRKVALTPTDNPS